MLSVRLSAHEGGPPCHHYPHRTPPPRICWNLHLNPAIHRAPHLGTGLRLKGLLVSIDRWLHQGGARVSVLPHLPTGVRGWREDVRQPLRGRVSVSDKSTSRCQCCTYGLMLHTDFKLNVAGLNSGLETLGTFFFTTFDKSTSTWFVGLIPAVIHAVIWSFIRSCFGFRGTLEVTGTCFLC